MADRSKIEWTDASWNPIRARLLRKVGEKPVGSIGWHCERVTTGCGTPKEGGCYAEAINWRLGTGLPFKPSYLEDGIVELFLDDNILKQPLRWKRPRKVFPCSMTDMFGRFVKDEWLDKIFAVMALTQEHDYQVLTKRSERMRAYLTAPDLFARLHAAIHCAADYERPEQATRAFMLIGHLKSGSGPALWPLPNVWLGVSVERQQEADARIPDLLQTPAAVRFISAEPLLGPIDLTSIRVQLAGESWMTRSALHARDRLDRGRPEHRLDWVIVGGESGRNARPMHPDWARSLRDQCQAAGVAFFFKQWGEWAAETQFPKPTRDSTKGTAVTQLEGGQLAWKIGKAAAGRLLDGVEHNAFPTPRAS
ncbi:phage Gp37/Gp68 family protein [Bradyrhizobium sp. 83012]|uniref:Phage Gp37/Gp68 family protein n=1 Tax=Bradyrhizobium aeschynomenes TaxID=2734909 RepID=A0ABX2CRE0_9BRAD|nr:phage Gp37/Gp68 family protein [Bradyrhizobium aeschynomenes]